MKQFKILVALLFATAIAVPAMATTVTWTGGANARFGYQQLNADNIDPWSVLLMSSLSSNTTAFGSDLEANMTEFGAKCTTMATEYTIFGMGGPAPSAASQALYAKAQKHGMAANFSNLAALAATPSWAIGMGVMKDADYTKKGDYVGLKNENSVNLAANVVSDSKKLTAKIEAKFATPSKYQEFQSDEASATRPIDLQAAWVKYDLGMAAIKYNTADLSNRWDSDIIYVGNYTGQNSLDFEIKPVADMGYAFFTIMSDNGFDRVKYESTEMRTTPMFSAGYVYESSMIDATLGGVYDSPTKEGGDYTGYLAFADVKVKSGQMGTEVGSFLVELSGVYGKNTARFAGMDPADMEQATLGVSNLDDFLLNDDTLIFNTIAKAEKDSTVKGGHLSATYTAWMGGMINFDARVSQCTINDSDPFFSQRYTLAIIQALDANFFVTLAGGYEQYSVQPGDENAYGETVDAAWGYEATLDFGYRF